MSKAAFSCHPLAQLTYSLPKERGRASLAGSYGLVSRAEYRGGLHVPELQQRCPRTPCDMSWPFLLHNIPKFIPCFRQWQQLPV